MCAKTDTRVSFTPPEVMEDDHFFVYEQRKPNQHFSGPDVTTTLCQRVVEIRMNEDQSKQMRPNFSGLCIERMGDWQLYHCPVFTPRTNLSQFARVDRRSVDACACLAP